MFFYSFGFKDFSPQQPTDFRCFRQYGVTTRNGVKTQVVAPSELCSFRLPPVVFKVPLCICTLPELYIRFPNINLYAAYVNVSTSHRRRRLLMMESFNF